MKPEKAHADAKEELDPWQIVQHPRLTEKNVDKIDLENKLVFIVDQRATKAQIKWAVEELFDVEVDNVNTLIAPNGNKKAYIKLNESYDALDVATDLGMM